MRNKNFSLKNYKVLSIIIFSLLLLVPQQPFVFAFHNDQLVVQTGDVIDGKTLTAVESPSINDNGDIVFQGDFSGGTGIFTPTSLLAQTGDVIDGKTLTGVAEPEINNNGDIVFRGFFSGGHGIFTHGQGIQCGLGTILQGNECVIDPNLTVISINTVLETSTVVNGSVLVQSNSILTIPSGVTLTIPSENHLRIEPGSGVLIKAGGTLKVIS